MRNIIRDSEFLVSSRVMLPFPRCVPHFVRHYARTRALHLSFTTSGAVTHEVRLYARTRAIKSKIDSETRKQACSFQVYFWFCTA